MRAFLLFLFLRVIQPVFGNDFYETGAKYGTDKVTGHKYHHTYHQFLRYMKHKPVKLLEIGLG